MAMGLGRYDSEFVPGEVAKAMTFAEDFETMGNHSSLMFVGMYRGSSETRVSFGVSSIHCMGGFGCVKQANVKANVQAGFVKKMAIRKLTHLDVYVFVSV